MAAKKPVKKTTKKDPTWDEIGESIGKKIENWEHNGSFKCKIKDKCCEGSGGFFYLLGFIGSLIYYGTTATSLWGAFIGFLKSLVWPAFLVFNLFKFIGA